MASFGVPDVSEDENKTFWSLESLKCLRQSGIFRNIVTLVPGISLPAPPITFVSGIPQKLKKAYLGTYL